MSRNNRSKDVFKLPDSDPYTNSDSHSYGIGCYCFLKKSVQWTYADSYGDSYSDTDWYCTQFDTDISNFHCDFASEWPLESVPVETVCILSE